MATKQTTPKHAGGRPTKYDKKFCRQLEDYFNIEPFETVEVKTTDKRSGRVYLSEEVRANRLPTLERFAFDIGVTDDTIVRWASEKHPDDYRIQSKRGKLKHPEFSAAYRRAKMLQKDILMVNGSLGYYAANYTKFVSTNLTDLRDNQNVDITSKGKSIAPKVVSEIQPHVAAEAEATPGNSASQ